MSSSKNIIEVFHELQNDRQLIDEKEILAFKSATENILKSDIDYKAYIDGENFKRPIEDLNYNEDTHIGILPIVGVLTYRPSWCWWYSTSSYISILEDFKTMLEAGAKTIVLDIDSGGGIAYGVFETSAQLRTMADEAGVKLIGYVDGRACSAAYGLPVSCHEFIANPDAQVGSIGVMVALTDYSEYYKRVGIKDIYITAGKGKVPFDDDGSFSEQFKDRIQEGVDKTYSRFTNHVADNRNLTQEQIIEYGAVVYDADEALERGLIDKVMTRAAFAEYLSDLSTGDEKRNDGVFTSFMSTNLKETDGIENMADVETTALQTQLADLQTKLAQSEREQAALKSELESQKQATETAKSEAQANEQAAKQTKLQLRTKTLEDVIGTEKAKELAESLESLSDEAFGKVVSSYKAHDSEFEQEAGDAGKQVITEPATNVDTAKTLSDSLLATIKGNK